MTSDTPLSKSMTVLSAKVPDAQNISAGKGVMGALRSAAERTGVDFSFLLTTAQRESALNPKARAGTSSASGLFQFIEQTWLGVMKTHGQKHGYGALSQAITKAANGRYQVADPAQRQQILALRFNPQAASTMAAEMTATHAAYLKGRLGRDVTGGELYAAHFLGPSGAAELILATQTRPQALAAQLFPQAAAANRSIFYTNGRAASVTEVMANLSRNAGSGRVVPDDGLDNANLYAGEFYRTKMRSIHQDAALLQMAFGTDEPSFGSDKSAFLRAFAPDIKEAEPQFGLTI
jgi:hypothetical protein